MFNLINKLRSVIERQKLLDDLTNAVQNNDVENLLNLKALYQGKDIDLTKSFRYSSSVKAYLKMSNFTINELVNYVVSVDEFLSDSKNNKLLLNEISNFPETMVSSNLTIKQATCIKLINDIVMYKAFHDDLVDLIISTVDDNAILKFGKFREASIKEQITYYLKTAGYFTRNKDVFKKLSKLPDVAINTDELDESEYLMMIKSNGIDSSMPMLSNNFNGSPIYFVIKLIEDGKFMVYEYRKKKSEMIAKKIQYLQMKNEDIQDAKTEKVIENYKKEIEKLEYKIAQYEDDE